MHTRKARRGGEGLTNDATARTPSARVRNAALLMSLTAMLFAIGGCAQAEKARYMRHLTTAVEPNAAVPEEAILTFDIDRKRLRGAVAVGGEH